MRGSFLALLVAAKCFAQEPPAFRAGVSLVHVDAAVTDGIRTLTGFHQDDFVVKDNGAAQTILHFSQEEEPLDLILLFDISGSMRSNVARVAASGRTALAELREGDRIAVMTFNRGSRLVAPFTDDLDAVERSINAVVDGRFGGGTHILAAVDDAAQYFMDQPRTQRRRAVLILTDNMGQRSKMPGGVVNHLWEADAVLSGLLIRSGVETALATASMVTNPLVLALREGMQGVAEKTGGDSIKADDPGEGFRDMLQRLRRRYSLYYAMPQGKPGEKREIKVELTSDALKRNPGSRVRARKGYVVPK
jgi:VWFA-related protein